MRTYRRLKRGPKTLVEIINGIIDGLEELSNKRPGPGLAKTADGTLYVIGPPKQVRRGAATGDEMPAKITGHTYVEEYNAYEYEWHEAYKNPLGTDGYDTWIAKPDGRNSDDDGIAHNGAEYNFAHIEGGDARQYQPQPVEDGALVWIHEEVQDEWWFYRDVNSEMGQTPNGNVQLGSSGSVVSATLDETTYDFEDDDGKGVTSLYLTGVYYDNVNHKFFVKYRAQKTDAGGAVIEVSAEAAAEVVALVECEPET